MKLRDVSDRTEDNPYSVADTRRPETLRSKPIETDAIVSKILGYDVKGDDKRLVQFVVQLKKELGPEAPVQYLLNTSKTVQEQLKAMFS